MKSILDIDCSYYANVSATDPETINLLKWLKSDKYLSLQEEIRKIKDENKKKVAKLRMPCITPSGLFSKRDKEHLIRHTGFIAIDIDKKDNLHLSNFNNLKSELCKIPNVAYIGQSVSGAGFWALIPIAHPEKHEEHFRFIKEYLKAKGLIIDSACKDVTRLRFYSFDPTAYFNHAARLLESFYAPPALKPYQSGSAFETDHTEVWKGYNESCEFICVLEKHGWKIHHQNGFKTYFTRPGKSSGISAEYDVTKRIFYVFTSSTQFEGSKGYNPFQIYAILEHAGDFRKATKALYSGRMRQ